MAGLILLFICNKIKNKQAKKKTGGQNETAGETVIFTYCTSLIPTVVPCHGRPVFTRLEPSVVILDNFLRG